MPAIDSASSDPSVEAAGFRMQAQLPASLRIEVWGYWTPEIAGAFTREASAVVQKLGEAAAFHLDAKDLKPQSGEGQEALRVIFRALGATGFGKATAHTENVLTRMQLTRLLRECGLDARVRFE
jgi:hypothetical protein